MTGSTKEVIRAEALRRRDAIPAEERAELSRKICDRVISDERYVVARGIHVYLPFGSEVDIKPLIEVSWAMRMSVGLMRVQEDGGIAHLSITAETEYRRTKLGILEPIEADPFDMDSCDLIIVPVVAADPACNRLGYGKGYYDQFLLHYPRPAIGMAFDVQIFDELPVNEDDAELDLIYTESRLIESGADLA